MLEFDEFAASVRRITGLRVPLLPETDIVHDIGLAGADGEELIDGLKNQYGLEFTEDEVLQHFGEERAATPWSLWLRFTGRMTPLKPLRMIDLYQRVSS
jgi:hypothetical protein